VVSKTAVDRVRFLALLRKALQRFTVKRDRRPSETWAKGSDTEPYRMCRRGKRKSHTINKSSRWQREAKIWFGGPQAPRTSHGSVA
jgi:hypothetical protein